MKCRLELHIAGLEKYELTATNYFPTNGADKVSCFRGKSSGAFPNCGSFQWTRAVRGFLELLLRCKIHVEDKTVEPFIFGERGSIAVALDYAIHKQPLWMLDLFGVQEDGSAVLKRLFKKTNTHLKHPGPVFISLNTEMLPPDSIVVVRNSLEVPCHKELTNILNNLKDVGRDRSCEMQQSLSAVSN